MTALSNLWTWDLYFQNVPNGRNCFCRETDLKPERSEDFPGCSKSTLKSKRERIRREMMSRDKSLIPARTEERGRLEMR
jgi:hypothetical protein